MFIIVYMQFYRPLVRENSPYCSQNISNMSFMQKFSFAVHYSTRTVMLLFSCRYFMHKSVKMA